MSKVDECVVATRTGDDTILVIVQISARASKLNTCFLWYYLHIDAIAVVVELRLGSGALLHLDWWCYRVCVARVRRSR